MKRRPWLLLGPVFLYVHLRGFLGVVRRMKRVAVGDMRVMRCLLVVPLIVMCRCFFVVTSSMLVMFGCRRIIHVRKGSPGFRACPTPGCSRPTEFGVYAMVPRPSQRRSTPP
jgi:hypothetical protein